MRARIAPTMRRDLMKSGKTQQRAGEAPDSDKALIRRAEAALDRLSSHFAQWMDDECSRLETIGRRIEAGDRSPETLDALYTAAHDIKGEATTFGYPKVETQATLLCAMLDSPRKRAQASVEAIGRIIGRVRAAVEHHPK